MKRKLLILSVLAICIATFAVGTLAYVSSEVTTHNVITTGGVDIELKETGEDGKPFEDQTGIMPGMEVTKIVQVKNIGKAEAWIRLKITTTVTGADGKTLPADQVKLNINNEFWAQQGEYLYYKKAVKPGDITEPAFTTVTFEKTMGNEYQNAKAVITVDAFAVQTANNGTTWDTVKPESWPNDTKTGVDGAVTG